MRNLFRTSLSILVFSCLAATAFAQSVRTFVSTSGSDANPCTRAEPCRNFAAAINAVSSGGEVVVLDSGGYGPVIIEKSVTLVAPSGVYAAIAPTTGEAVTVSTFGPAVVALRGLSLNGMGATTGIGMYFVGGLHVEGCVISNFTDDGVQASGGEGDLTIVDTIIRGNGVLGVRLNTPEVVNAVLDRVRIERNGSGVFFTGASVKGTLRDCLVALSTASDAITVSGGQANIENCVVSHNLGSGIIVVSNGTVRVSSTMVANNSVGFNPVSGTFLSFGNNRVRGNGADILAGITVVSQN